RKRRQIVYTLADADKMHGNSELARDGDQNAAACRAVELGHGEPGHTDGFAENFDLGERVLSDGGVEYEQNGMRRRWVGLLDHTYDFLQFVHQFAAVLQAAGGIDEQYVDVAFFGRTQRVEDQAGGVRAGFLGDERRA